MNIQWFPGHMTKTKRMIEEDIKIVDAVAEITDARCPESSRNPLLSELTAGKPRIIILNKCDYADDDATKKWREFYLSKGLKVLICDCRSGKGVKNFAPLLNGTLSELTEKRLRKGMSGKSLRVMTAGIPNVGKSSFINRMSNSRAAKIGDKPGITRGKQWITVSNKIELLDTPGILWHKFDDKNAALKLAFTGAIKDEVTDAEELATELIGFLRAKYPGALRIRYNIPQQDNDTLENIAAARNMRISGGSPDRTRAAAAVLDDFRAGKLGKITLELPEDYS